MAVEGYAHITIEGQQSKEIYDEIMDMTFRRDGPITFNIDNEYIYDGELRESRGISYLYEDKIHLEDGKLTIDYHWRRFNSILMYLFFKKIHLGTKIYYKSSSEQFMAGWTNDIEGRYYKLPLRPFNFTNDPSVETKINEFYEGVDDGWSLEQQKEFLDKHQIQYETPEIVDYISFYRVST